MAFPSFDTATNSWAPQADISWPIGPERQSAFVRFPLRVMTESEAVACALRRSQSWIDNRLKARSAENAATLVIDRINPLPNSFRRTNLKPPAKPKPTIRNDSTESFTFAQFKSALMRPGTKVADSVLRKSYSGLMQLQKNKNWSTAEIRAMVNRVQELLLFQSKRRGQRCRLPMTE
ncbi:MAG TPA: hypothetical protein VFY96_17305, partial [Candidatus Binatia bacterium]|nr:hypothetical protein [Candidatus Binatia bacterium]